MNYPILNLIDTKTTFNIVRVQPVLYRSIAGLVNIPGPVGLVYGVNRFHFDKVLEIARSLISLERSQVD